MKIGLLKTYFCDDCQRHLDPIWIDIDWPDDAGSIYRSESDRKIIWVTYECVCHKQNRAVKYIIDENNELVPDHSGVRY